MKSIVVPILRPDMLPVLAGRLDGKRTLARNIEETPRLTTPALLVLDFRGVEIATSSFLDEAVIRFRDHLRLGSTPGYLIVANLNEKVEEELSDLLTLTSDALVACSLSSEGNISDKRLIGSLEQKLSETLDLVKGGATAMQLHSQVVPTDKRIVPTAWNNRLSKLSAKSLVVEEQQPGRTKKYMPLMEVV